MDEDFIIFNPKTNCKRDKQTHIKHFKIPKHDYHDNARNNVHHYLSSIIRRHYSRKQSLSVSKSRYGKGFGPPGASPDSIEKPPSAWTAIFI